jgi:DNA-binding NarL/FixJ family response regulator
MNLNTCSSSAHPAQRAAIRVLLADDHAVTLWGLSQLVDSARPRMKVAGTATSCAELLSHPALADTDVVLLDLGLRDANAIDCVRELVDVGVQVVLLTGDLDPSHHREAVMRGARGVVLKSQSTERIIEAIEHVHAGEVSFDGALMSMLLGRVPGMLPNATQAAPDETTQRIQSLTPKERQVIQAIVKHRGAKSLVVAEQCHVSEHTLRNHLTVIYSKLNVQGRLNLYVLALEHGLASDPSYSPKAASDAPGLSGSGWSR